MVVCGDRPPDHARGAGGPGPGGVQPPGQHAAQQQTGAGAGEGEECSVSRVLLLPTLQGGCPGRCTNLVVCSLQGGTLQQAGGCRGLLTGCCRLPSRRPPPRLSRVPRQLGWGQYGHLQQQRGRQPRHLPSHSEAAPSVRSVKRPPHPPPPPPPPPPGDLSTNLVPGTGASQCGVAQPVAQRRILGGAEAGRGQFPWSAVIHISSEVGS